MLNECNGCEYKCSLSHIDICTLGSPCPHQRSTPMTNEEWFDTLSTTEEKAEAIYECTMENSWSFNKDGIKRWLKQPHTEKE